MTALLVGRLRELATQTHLLEKKVDALGWMAANGPQTFARSMRSVSARPSNMSPHSRRNHERDEQPA